MLFLLISALLLAHPRVGNDLPHAIERRQIHQTPVYEWSFGGREPLCRRFCQ